MAKAKEQVARLEEKVARARAELQRARAREQQQKRKDDTRRKVLIGAMTLHQIREDEFKYRELVNQLDEYLTHDRDRRLFDLPEHQTPKPRLNPGQQVED
jgi:hypothetical protein